MKQIIYKQVNPQHGKITGDLRIRGKLLYFKFNNNQYAQQMITQLQNKGAVIKIGKSWIEVSMFHNQEIVKLGEKEFDVTEKSDEEMEEILYDFYTTQFKKAKFEVE